MLLKLTTFLLLLRLTLLEITKLQLKRWEDMIVERAKQCALPQEQKR